MSKPTKKHGAATGARATCRLQPVSYQISLVYLGDERIQRQRGVYQCRFTLERDDSLKSAAAPFVIPNVVHMPDDLSAPGASQDARLAAKSNTDGGDNRNPPGDQVHRILIRDGHSHTNTFNRRAEYKNNDWDRDVEPAAAFRVVIRKFCGDKQVDVEDAEGLSVDVELKDPPEELDQTDGRPRAFLSELFGYDEKVGPEQTGNDNGPEDLGGVRDGANGDRLPVRAEDGSGGLDATRLLRAAPAAELPNVDEHLPPIQKAGLSPDELKEQLKRRQLRFARLSAPATGDAPNVGRFKVRSATERIERRVLKPKRAVGLADFVLLPGPIGGDNYRFLITLRAAGQDVRETSANGGRVTLRDDGGRKIPHPCGYLTGRFIVWRRLPVRLVILANGLQLDAVDWRRLRRSLAHAFVDLPEVKSGLETTIYTLPRAEWEVALFREFNPTHRDWTNPAHFDQTAYETCMFPLFLFGSEVTDSNHSDHMTAIAERLVRDIGDRFGHNPTADPNQRGHHNGLFLVVAKVEHPSVAAADQTNVIGFCMGNRMLWADGGAGQAETTRVLQHELGHALYLQHAETETSDGVKATHVRGKTMREATRIPIRIIDPTQDFTGETLDHHDPLYWLECCMSYKKSPHGRYCGKCALVLRHYDLDTLARANKTERLAPLNPAIIVEAAFGITSSGGVFTPTLRVLDPGAFDPRGAPTPSEMFRPRELRAGDTLHLLALSTALPPTPPLTEMARINLTNVSGAASPANWRVSPAPAGTIRTTQFRAPGFSVDAIELKLSEAAAGQDVTVTFALDGAAATAVFGVAP